MLRSPSKQYCSDPDLSDQGTVTHRKRRHGDDFYEMFTSFTTEMRSWKTEIQQDISHIKTNLDSGLQELRSEISSIRQEHTEFRKTVHELSVTNGETRKLVTSLETSVQFNTDQCEELKEKVDSLVEKNKSLSSLEEKLEVMTRNYNQLLTELNANNQRDRLMNLEIVGVPENKEENIIELVLAVAAHADVDISPNDILEAHRVTPRVRLQGRPRNIVVRMKSRVIKDNILSGVRRNRLTTKNLNMSGSAKPVFVNEHLTYYNKQLLKKCREVAKLKNFQYVWIKHGRIYVRKADGSPPIQIRTEKDVSKIS
ncbi:uncharacterized protein LOC128677873 [Plodia interpunctella]|nr:uncharacterized protein LOC128675614 [Plodia interpunctella]XP_053615014.1 uncharacterized protein LOC128677873 [Plodia interpunctella]